MDKEKNLPEKSSIVQEAWKIEAKRRLDEYRNGKATLVEPSETFAKTKKLIHQAMR